MVRVTVYSGECLGRVLSVTVAVSATVVVSITVVVECSSSGEHYSSGGCYSRVVSVTVEW